jgi:peptide-methionine (R)-S-oxide reductase
MASKAIFLIFLCFIITTGCRRAEDVRVQESQTMSDKSQDSSPAEVIKTDAQWRELLTSEQYRITRQKATERPFTGRYADCFDPGVYRCVCCGAPLFASDDKFHSGCGWPAFSRPIEEQSVRETPDDSFGMLRTEITCRRCGAHLGHVFDDGPGPAGLRYCINSASLKLQPGDKSRHSPKKNVSQ